MTPTLGGSASYVDEFPDPLLVHNLEDGDVVLWYRLGDEAHNAQRIRQDEEAATRRCAAARADATM